VPQVRLEVLGNRTIRVAIGSLSPVAHMRLEIWSEQEGEDTLRLDDSRAMEAMEADHEP
jgi:hypothetical protein